MSERTRNVATALISCFGLLAVVQAYWQVIASPALTDTFFDRHSELLAKIAQPGSITTADGQQVLVPVKTNGQWLFRYEMPKEFAHITGYNARTGLQGKLVAALYGKPPYSDWKQQLLAGRPRGSTIELTVNSAVQRHAAELLGERPGCAIVIRVKDAAVLAAVSSPSYDCVEIGADPTALEIAETDPTEPLTFRPIQKLYAPGWAMAWVTAAAALENLRASQELDCDGAWRLGTLTVECHRAHGRVDVARAVEYGCKVGIAQLAHEMGPDVLRATIKRLHLLDAANMFLDSVPGKMPDFYSWRGPRNLIEAALGTREARLTPLAVARFFLCVARGGTVVQPYLIRSIVSPGGKVWMEGGPRVLGQGLSPSTSAMLMDLLTRTAASLPLEDNAILGGGGLAAVAWWHGDAAQRFAKGESFF
ncbi:MAG: hypothetical protein H5T86_10400, partial [Armatimonadetes bacterium]|nr:hypothetical protein [Armatimonadota bacterium]